MYAVILLPDFALQCALRAEPEPESVPVALIGQAGSEPSVQQINAPARADGVEVGMSLPQALARSPKLIFKRTSRRQEAVATAALLQFAEHASPYLEHTFPGCCTLDLRRHGELEHAAWANDLRSELASLSLFAQVGIAATPDAALQAARLGQGIVSTTEAFERLMQLPLPVLGPSERLLGVFYDWGIERVADLRALDRQEVAERLGHEGLALWDRAAGGTMRPLRLVRPSETYEEVAEFEGGIETLEPLLFRLRRALEQLTQRLRTDFFLVGAVELILDLDDRTHLGRTIEIPAPTCEADVLYRVLSTYLDTITTDSRVNAFRLQAFPSAPRDHQRDLWKASLRDPNAFSQTLAQLSGVVGNDQMGTPRRLPTHRPDRFRLEKLAFDAEGKPQPPQKRGQGPASSAPLVFPPLGLSLRRYRPPFRVKVESSDERPVCLHGGDVDDRVRASAGPWRLDGHWWDEADAWRWEEWDVELSRGGLYRLANHREVHWWMLGLYD